MTAPTTGEVTGETITDEQIRELVHAGHVDVSTAMDAAGFDFTGPVPTGETRTRARETCAVVYRRVFSVGTCRQCNAPRPKGCTVTCGASACQQAEYVDNRERRKRETRR